MKNLTEFQTFSEQPVLNSAPIIASWIVEGSPLARSYVLANGTDGSARIIAWDCTAGKFHWYYSFDETAVVQEGGVTLYHDDGRVVTLKAGDTVFFPKGSHAFWHVEDYIKKIAFCQEVLPARFAKPAALLRKIIRKLTSSSETQLALP